MLEIEDFGYESGSVLTPRETEKSLLANDSVTSSIKQETIEKNDLDLQEYMNEHKIEPPFDFASQSTEGNNAYELGRLAWARMSIYPFWPCIVTYDPESNECYQKVQATGRSKSLMVHVHFFNDNGQHSWVAIDKIMPFYGLEHFKKKAALITDEMKKKNPKLAAAFSIKPNIFKKWQIAVAEALDVMYELDLSTLEKFKPKLKDITNDTPPKKQGRKRKRSIEKKGIEKYLRPMGTSNVSFSNDNEEFDEDDEDSDEQIMPKKVKRSYVRSNTLKNKIQPSDFEAYYQKHSFILKQQHPNVTDEDIKVYLEEVWKDMTPAEKLKLRGAYRLDGR